MKYRGGYPQELVEAITGKSLATPLSAGSRQSSSAMSEYSRQKATRRTAARLSGGPHRCAHKKKNSSARRETACHRIKKQLTPKEAAHRQARQEPAHRHVTKQLATRHKATNRNARRPSPSQWSSSSWKKGHPVVYSNQHGWQRRKAAYRCIAFTYLQPYPYPYPYSYQYPYPYTYPYPNPYP